MLRSRVCLITRAAFLLCAMMLTLATTSCSRRNPYYTSYKNVDKLLGRIDRDLAAKDNEYIDYAAAGRENKVLLVGYRSRENPSRFSRTLMITKGSELTVSESWDVPGERFLLNFALFCADNDLQTDFDIESYYRELKSQGFTGSVRPGDHFTVFSQRWREADGTYTHGQSKLVRFVSDAHSPIEEYELSEEALVSREQSEKRLVERGFDPKVAYNISATRPVVFKMAEDHQMSLATMTSSGKGIYNLGSPLDDGHFHIYIGDMDLTGEGQWISLRPMGFPRKRYTSMSIRYFDEANAMLYLHFYVPWSFLPRGGLYAYDLDKEKLSRLRLDPPSDLLFSSWDVRELLR